MEKWLPVIDRRGRVHPDYQVSDRGRIRTFLVPGRSQLTPKPRLKAIFPDKGGFINVSLRIRGGGTYVHLVHQLVALAFLGRRSSRNHVVIHINHDRTDNRLKNLRWVTRAAASQHSMAIKPRRGIHVRFTPTKVRGIRKSRKTIKQLAELHGVTVQSIHAIIKRKTWKDVE